MQHGAWHNVGCPRRQVRKIMFLLENADGAAPCRRPPPTAIAPPPRSHPAARLPIDDTRIREIMELAPPAHLLREFPASERAADHHVRGPAGDPSRAARRRRPAARRGRPLLDPRLRRRDRLRDAAVGAEARARRRPRRRDARLFREAAHDRRLEGTHQRPASRRQLPDQRGAAARAPDPASRSTSSTCPPAPNTST